MKLREKIIDSIPVDLKAAIGGGIGLFIAFIGMGDGGLVSASKDTMVTLGSLHVGTTWLTIFGLLITVILMSMRIPGAIFIGMVLNAILGMVTGLIPLPHQWVAPIPSLKPTFGVAISHIGDINSVQLIVVVLTFLLVTFFDTAGTLVGLAEQAGFIKNNKIPRIGRALIADSSTMLAGLILELRQWVPSSNLLPELRSVAEPALLPLSSESCSSWERSFSTIDRYYQPSYRPSLDYRRCLDGPIVEKRSLEKFEIAAPAFITLVGMPFTYSIADGIALGFITYPITMIAARRGKEVSAMMYGLAVVFVIFLWILNN